MTENLSRYEILEEIGRGSFAVVYRARDTQLDRLVALKALKPTLLDTAWVRRFRREARTIARLKHPHIVTIYDVYQEQDRLFIVMQLVDGPSLDQLITRQGRLAWSEVLELMAALAQGLDYAHAQNILHRDLKPANILLDPEYGPLLSDFGLAKLGDKGDQSVTAAGSVVGTPHYIAPEVWEGQGTTPQSDIYALGCILYEMLTGERIFQGDTPPAVMMAHFRPPPLSNVWSEGVPVEVADVLKTVLASRPEERYATAGEMIEALAGLAPRAATPSTAYVTSSKPGNNISILATKLYSPPPRPDVVARPRLKERLTEALHRQHKLTLVSAPAGFGKTTLVSDWLSDMERPSTWLALDEKDNDLARFLSYIITALQQIEAGLGRTTQVLLEASPSPNLEPLLTALINDIAALDTAFVFVLDDYHVITLFPIHEAVAFLLDHMPSQMHLIVTSRADLPLSLSRLRVRRQVTEIRAADLRFLESETSTFLNQTMGLNLPPEAIAALETRTEGWIAGLQLAALSMETLAEAPKRDFITALTGNDRYILDYLIEEVLDRQPEHIQTFLLQTSILERLSGPLCDAVLGIEQDGKIADDEPVTDPPSFAHSLFTPSYSHKILEYLEHNNLFIVPLDNKRQWYRYHHLFADLLHNQLDVSQPEFDQTLHRRASAWYEQNDMMSEAIAHSLAGRDVEQAARLVEQTFDDMMGRDEFFTTMLDRLEALPEEIIRARPRLGILYAWMLSITLQIDGVEPCLQAVEKLAKGQLPADLRRQMTHIRAELARYRQDVTQSIELSQQVLAALPEKPSGTDRQTLTGAVFNLAFVYLMQGDVVRAQERFSEALQLSQTVGSITLTLVAMAGQAQVQVLQGHLNRTTETYQRALQLAAEVTEQRGRAVPAAAYIKLGLGELLREQNSLAEAAGHLTQGLELAQQWRINEVLRDGYIFLARLKQAQGDMVGALHTLEQAEQLPAACQVVGGLGGPIAACRAQLMLAQVVTSSGAAEPHYLEAVERWAETRKLSAEVPLDLLDDEFEALIWVRLRIMQNQPDQVLPLLTRLQRRAESGGRFGRMIEILNLQALAQQALGHTDQALIALEQALSLAQPEGYVRLFVDEGLPLAKLLQQVTSRQIAVDYVGKLIDAFSTREQGSRGAGEKGSLSALPSAAPPTLIEPLSDRELDVLHLLNTDLSGPEIAAELVVSVNTVKTHIKHIYDKLNAHSRYEAVERAKELRLL